MSMATKFPPFVYLRFDLFFELYIDLQFGSMKIMILQSAVFVSVIMIFFNKTTVLKWKLTLFLYVFDITKLYITIFITKILVFSLNKEDSWHLLCSAGIVRWTSLFRFSVQHQKINGPLTPVSAVVSLVFRIIYILY